MYVVLQADHYTGAPLYTRVFMAVPLRVHYIGAQYYITEFPCAATSV